MTVANESSGSNLDSGFHSAYLYARSSTSPKSI